MASGRPLDMYASSPTAGTQLELWGINAGANQEWSITPNGNGYYTLENRSSGYVVDVFGASTSQGASVVQWPADNGTNQNWRLVKIG